MVQKYPFFLHQRMEDMMNRVDLANFPTVDGCVQTASTNTKLRHPSMSYVGA